jgi:hypothetical protein
MIPVGVPRILLTDDRIERTHDGGRTMNDYGMLYEMAQEHQHEMLEYARQARLLKQGAKPRRSVVDRVAELYCDVRALLV